MPDENNEDKRRCYLYSRDHIEGKIFIGGAAIAAAKKDGWRDSPAKVHEAIEKEEAEAEEKRKNEAALIVAKEEAQKKAAAKK